MGMASILQGASNNGTNVAISVSSLRVVPEWEGRGVENFRQVFWILTDQKS